MLALVMHAFPLSSARHHLVRQIVIWVLACALPINSISTVLLHLLGTQHSHSISSADADMTIGSTLSVRSMMRAIVGDGAMDLIDAYHAHEQHLRAPDALRRHGALPLQAHGMTEQEHAHAHSMLQRHHHDPADGTVIVLGEKETGHDGAGSASSFDASSAFPLPSTLMSARATFSTVAPVWPNHAITAWHNHVSAPLERPPRG